MAGKGEFFMSHPYSDNEMIYDRQKHRYILTEIGIANGMNVVLQDELNMTGVMNTACAIKDFLNDVSFFVYEYIYSHSADRMVTEYMLAKKTHMRDVIKTAMISQAKYLKDNGDVANQAGINFGNMSFVSLEEIRGDRRISPYTKSQLANAGLLYTGRMRLYKRIKYREDY